MALKKYVLITAGGTGNRMQSAIPKQFLLLKDKPVLMHTIQVFNNAFQDMDFLIVLPAQYWEDWNKLCQEYEFSLAHQLVEGGEFRFHSVKNGLDFIREDGIVAIHDAVRPLVSDAVVKNGFAMAEEHGNAIPCVPVNESVRMSDEKGNRPINRDQLRLIQTPQVFRTSLIKEAYKVEYDSSFTDDASVIERMGRQIYLYEGNPENIKITRPADMVLADALYKSLNS